MQMVLIANIIDFLAAMLQVASGSIKNKAKILVVQTVQLLMQGVSMLLVGGITGAVNNALSCLRNYLCYKDQLNGLWKAVIIVASVALTVCFNDQGLLGIIPVAVCTVYILLMDLKEPIAFKLLVTLSFVPWVFYHAFVGLYVAAVFDVLSVITNAVTLGIMIKEKKASR